jgi:hypothetical protein
MPEEKPPFAHFAAVNGALECRYCHATCASTPEELDAFDSSRVTQWVRRHSTCLERVFRQPKASIRRR